jgi:hypothetical protein
MEVSIVRQNKDKLEDSIRELIIFFEKETCLQVDKIHIFRVPMYSGFNEDPGGLYIQTEVKI